MTATEGACQFYLYCYSEMLFQSLQLLLGILYDPTFVLITALKALGSTWIPGLVIDGSCGGLLEELK